MRPELAAALVGLAKKRLPIAPGDLLQFHFSGNRLLVITTSDQTGHPSSGDPRSLLVLPPGSIGQMVGGLMSTGYSCEAATLWVDWSGYGTHWAIHRPTV